ncbi:MAG: hypothetical protein ACYDDF_03510 [Thermoplasmatota archaeon]
MAMKAEAYYDRVGLAKQKYLEALTLVRGRLEEGGVTLKRAELERVVRMRHERKHDDMLTILFRVFAKLTS